MAKQIRTVLGPIAPEQLGVTTMHEHILFEGGVLAQRLRPRVPKGPHVKEFDKLCLENVGLLHKNAIMCWDALSAYDEEAMTGEVQDFKESGGNAILELSVPGIRYDVASNKRISEKTGVHVIIATGYYTEDSWPDELRGLSLEDYRKSMLHDIEHGVEDTGLIPGCLKIAMNGLSVQEEKTLRAAARVCAETGYPFTIHPGFMVGGDSLNIAKILKEEGVDLSRVVIAHMGASDGHTLTELLQNPSCYVPCSTEFMERLLDTGINISMEFGSPMCQEHLGGYAHPDWPNMAGLIALIKKGYASQLVLGTDTCGKIMTRRFGGEGYCRLTSYILPALQKFGGVSAYAIRQMMVENPARILAI